MRIFSEQQLRRYHKDDYPEYVCKYRRHVPDGYTFIPRGNGGTTIAFEAELNAKGQNDYSSLYGSYGTAKVDHVFWLGPKLTTTKRIWRYVQKKWDNDEPRRHSFITYPGFLRKGWGAEIVCGTGEGCIPTGQWISKEIPLIFISPFTGISWPLQDFSKRR